MACRKLALAVRPALTIARRTNARLLGGFGLPLGTAGAAVLGALALSALAPSNEVVLLGFLSVILLAPIAYRALQRRFDPFEPTVLFALVFGSMFLVRPIAVVVRQDYAYQAGVVSVDIRAGFEEMLVVAVIGALGFVLGYALPAGRRVARRLPRPPRRYSGEVASVTAATFAAVGVALFALFLVAGGGGSALQLFLAGRSAGLQQLLVESNKYLIFAPIVLLPAAVVLLALGAARRSVVTTCAGGVAALALVLVAAPTGSRSLLFPLFIGLAIYFYLTKGTRPSLKTLSLAILLALFLSAFIGTVRTADVRQTVGIGPTFSAIVDDPTEIFAPLVEGEDAAEATGLAALLALPSGSIEPANGRAVVGDLLVRPIPRSLWSGKPQPPRQKVTRALFGRYADTFLANPEYSVLLYPYLDAGHVGVLLLMLLYGVAARALYEYTMRHRASLIARLLFALSVPALIAGMRDSPVDTLARVAFLVVPLLLIFGAARTAAPRLGAHASGRPS